MACCITGLSLPNNLSQALPPEHRSADTPSASDPEAATRKLLSTISARVVAGVALVVAATLIALVAGSVLEIGDSDQDESYLNVSELSFDSLVVTYDNDSSASSISPDNPDIPDSPDIPDNPENVSNASSSGFVDRKLGEYGGKPLVVNFFASWCPPCVREMPEFQRVFEKLNGRVAFLGLSQDRTAQDALDLVAATGVTYDVGWDLDLEIYQATESIAMPTTAFVSPEGDLLDTFAGLLNEEALNERIRSLFNIAIES